MSAATDYLEALIADHLTRDASWTKPSGLYVGLFTAMPNDDATGGTEVSGGSYARVQHGPGDAQWNVSSPGVVTNAGDITFPQATADWGQLVGVGVWDAATGGNLLFAAQLGATKTVGSGDPPQRFADGTLSVAVL